MIVEYLQPSRKSGTSHSILIIGNARNELGRGEMNLRKDAKVQKNDPKRRRRAKKTGDFTAGCEAINSINLP